MSRITTLALAIATMSPACKESPKGPGAESKATAKEVEVHLGAMARAAKKFAAAQGAYPVGDAPLTPATACCPQPDKKCPTDPAAWRVAPFAALGFRIDEPHAFQYAYTGTRNTFTARAVGDPGCTGKPVEYRIEGRMQQGNPDVTAVVKIGAD